MSAADRRDGEAGPAGAGLRVLHVASELYPLIKTGGLADVTGALPMAQAAAGLDVRVLLPGFPAVLAGLSGLRPIARLGPAFGAGRIDLLLGRMAGSEVPIYVIASAWLFERPGNPYQAADGTDWPDNHRRFALLSWVAAQLAAGRLDTGWQPQVLHAHDWHASLAIAYLFAHPAHRVGTVFTVHNLAFQGYFGADVFQELGLPQWMSTLHGIEFHGALRFLKGGLNFADRLTTVSPTYAREILSPEQGFQMDGLLRRRRDRLTGIVNGIDTSVWNPATDPELVARYDADDVSGKAACKQALQREFGLREDPDAMLIGVISRLTQQKGLDLLLAALPRLGARSVQVALLGSGDASLERGYTAAAAAAPARVGSRIGYDEALAHRIVAGSDVIAVPSRFEPCGLTQLYGLRYGTLPLVRRAGGLADTVIDADADAIAGDRATGFVFEQPSGPALASAAERAVDCFRQPDTWRQLMRRAMAQDFSWRGPAQAYARVYSEIVVR
jgi:starch synthase